MKGCELEMGEGFDLGEYLKEIEQNLKKELENMPDDVVEAIMDRSFHDAQQLFENGQQNDFKSLVYIIYRSYILGMQIEKLSHKPKIKKEDNVIRIYKIK